MALWLIPTGLIINLSAVVAQWQLGWDYRWCGFLLQIPREISAPFQVVLGCVALLYGFWPRLTDKTVIRLLSNVERMALTNYLLQTFLCTLLFNQLGLFMAYDRLQLMLFVPAGLAGEYYGIRPVAEAFSPRAHGEGVALFNAVDRRHAAAERVLSVFFHALSPSRCGANAPPVVVHAAAAVRAIVPLTFKL